MTVLGIANSRMKDFSDIWILITNLEVAGTLIQTVIQSTLHNRGTELPTEKHVVFSDECAENTFSSPADAIRRRCHAGHRIVIHTPDSYTVGGAPGGREIPAY